MMPIYNTDIETVYTYNEWLREYNRRENRRRIRQRTERLHRVRQCIIGFIVMAFGIAIPFFLEGDATFSLIAVPYGIYLMATREKIVTF